MLICSVNSDFERLLAIGRSYRCATVLALQTTAQMVHEDRPTFRDIVLETCRNKIILNLGSEEDAKRFSKEFGEYEVLKQTPSYKRDGMLIIPWRLDSMREEFRTKERYSYTDLMELPRYHAVVRTVVDGQPQQPVLGRLELSNWDRQRRKKKPARKDLTGKLEIDMPTSDLQDKKLDIIFDEQTEENIDLEETFFDVM